MRAVFPTPAAPKNTRRTSVLSFTSKDMATFCRCLLSFLFILFFFACGSFSGSCWLVSVMELDVVVWKRGLMDVSVPLAALCIYVHTPYLPPSAPSQSGKGNVYLSLNLQQPITDTHANQVEKRGRKKKFFSLQ